MITEIGKINLYSKHTDLKMWRVSVETGKRTIREHRHINFEIGLVLKGRGIYHTTLGNKSFAEGDIFIFPSNEPHCIIDVKEEIEILNLHFSNKIIDNNPLLNENYPYIFYNHSSSFNCKIEKNTSISQKLFEIKKELENKETGYNYIISGLVGQIFIELIRKHNFFSAEEELSSSIIKKLENGINYINQHYCEEITLEQIAEKSNISPNYFSALFKECLNMKLWDYITAKRIEKAKRILHKNDTAITVLEIAIRCGFNNTANFNRSFKLYTGVTPSIYRKNRYENAI